jgi:hypothetical protein
LAKWCKGEPDPTKGQKKMQEFCKIVVLEVVWAFCRRGILVRRNLSRSVCGSDSDETSSNQEPSQCSGVVTGVGLSIVDCRLSLVACHRTRWHPGRGKLILYCDRHDAVIIKFNQIVISGRNDLLKSTCFWV